MPLVVQNSVKRSRSAQYNMVDDDNIMSILSPTEHFTTRGIEHMEHERQRIGAMSVKDVARELQVALLRARICLPSASDWNRKHRPLRASRAAGRYSNYGDEGPPAQVEYVTTSKRKLQTEGLIRWESVRQVSPRDITRWRARVRRP